MELNTMEGETMGMKKLQNIRCLELEERVLKAEEKYIELETEFQKRNKEIESLELRFKELESEKLVVEEELRNLKESEEGSLIEQIMVNKALEFEKQVAENEAEDWKRKFEKLVETVRKLDEIGGFRYTELELDENMKLGLELARIKNFESCKVYQSSGSPYMATPVKDSILGTRRDNMASRRRVNKMLLFEDDVHKSTDAVDLCDSETEERSEKESADAMDTLEENYEDEDVEACDVNESTPLSSRKRKRVIASDSENDCEDEDDNEDVEACEVNNCTPLSGRKRKRVIASDSESDNEDEDEDVEACEVNKNTPLSGRKRIQVVSSDSESDDDEDEDVEACEVNENTPRSGRKRIQVVVSDSENDDDEDNVPISILKNLKPSNQEMSDLVVTPNKGGSVSGRSRTHRRLNKHSVSKEMSASKERLVGIPTTDDADDDETEEEPESESGSLDEFIVPDDSHETVSEKSDETGEEESDGKTDYAEVMSRLRRDKKPEKRKWEYEADMLADFGKDPELCMRAVCVLYRFQTDDEKVTRSSHISNGRGFSKFDAERGTRIGRFLTDDDPAGDLKKSVEQLKSFEFKAVEICGELALKYSKQLFEIYNNREDPFFTLPPSP